jgi:hypothetical protein
MGRTTPTSSEEEILTLIQQAWRRVRVAAPPQSRMRQANYLTTLNLKQVLNNSTRKTEKACRRLMLVVELSIRGDERVIVNKCTWYLLRS